MRRMLTERIELFCNHRWRVMKLAGDAEWPMTDNPVLALNYVRPGVYDFGAGWGKRNSNFILPVSPRLAVFTQVGVKETGPRHDRRADERAAGPCRRTRTAVGHRPKASALDCRDPPAYRRCRGIRDRAGIVEDLERYASRL